MVCRNCLNWQKKSDGQSEEIERLRAEVEEISQHRDEALVIVRAVEEWMAGRLNRGEMTETARRVLARWKDHPERTTMHNPT